MRRFIRTLLPSWLSARECDDGAKALAAYKEHHPVCVLMDVAMPEKDGFKAAAEITKFDPAARIIFVSQFTDAETRRAAKEAGGCGFVLKENLDSLAGELRFVAARQRKESPKL